MIPANRDALEISLLSVSDDVRGFCCGDPDLDDFILSDALRLQGQGVTSAYLARYEGELVGYVALLADIVELRTGERKRIGLGHSDSPMVPAVKIGRLAVTMSCRSRVRGIGTALVALSFSVATSRVASAIGCRLLTVDAYQQSVRFYESLGFVRNKARNTGDGPTVSMRLDMLAPNAPPWVGR